MRATIFSIVVFLGVGMSLIGKESWIAAVSPKLKEVERKLNDAKLGLDKLGDPVVGQTVQQYGYMHAKNSGAADDSRWVQVDLGISAPIDQIALIPAQNDSRVLGQPSFAFPRLFKVETSDDPDFATSRAVAVFDVEEFPDPGVAPVVFQAHHRKARYVRINVQAPAIFALAELMIISGNRNLAIGCKAKSSHSTETPPRWGLSNLVDGKTPLGPPILRDLLPYDGFYAGPPESETPVWMQMDLGRDYTIEEVRLHPVHARLGIDIPGFTFPARFRVEAASDPEFIKPTILLDASSYDFPNPGNNPVTIPAFGIKARYVRMTLLAAGALVHKERFGLSEMEVYADNTNLGRKAKVTSTADTHHRSKNWPKTLLNDGYTSYGRLIEIPIWLDQWTQRRELEAVILSLQHEGETLELLAMRRAKWLILGGGGVIIGGVGGFAFWLRRKRLRELEQFRKRLTQDLHDDIGSNLAAIAMISENAAGTTSGENKEDWMEVNQVARETTETMREMLWLAGGREELGIQLMPHLQIIAGRILAGRQWEWSEVVDGSPGEWPPEVRRQIVLFFKESLANVVRHSRAEKVTLAARLTSGRFELEIRDNGMGFQTDAASGGVGLRSLRDRAGALTGKLQIHTSPGAGTHIILSIPTTLLKTVRLAEIPKS